MKKYLIGLILIAFVVVPFVGQTATLDELLAQLAAIQAQIAAYQNNSATTPVCGFTHDLSLGDGEDDGLAREITALQRILIADGHLDIARPTGYFGKMTMAAVKQWQRVNTYKDGSLPVTGVIGWADRAVLCGRESLHTYPTTTPLITDIVPNGGQLVSGTQQTITWKVPSQYHANTNVDIDLLTKEPSNTGYINSIFYVAKNWPANRPYQWTVGKALNVGNISSAHNSSFRICITGTKICGTSYPTFDIISSVAQPSITVLSPNGGEVITTGQTHVIRWNSANIPASENVKIELGSNDTDTTYPGGTYFEDWIVERTLNTGSYVWKVPEYYGLGLKDASFKVKISSTSGVVDYSNADFTIKMGASNPTLTVSSPVAGSVYKTGERFYVNWTPYDRLASFGLTLLKKSDPSFRRWVSPSLFNDSNPESNYYWTIPADLSGNDYYLRVDTSRNGTRTGGIGYSGVFSITNGSTQSSVTVSSVSGPYSQRAVENGEIWVKGSHLDQATGLQIFGVSNGNYATMALSSSVYTHPSENQINITLPSNIRAGNYYLTVQSPRGDSNRLYFTVYVASQATQPKITNVRYSSPEAKIVQGTNLSRVTWQSEGNVPRVDVLVCIAGVSEQCFFAYNNIANVGQAEQVRFGTNIPIGSRAYVKVRQAGNNSVSSLGPAISVVTVSGAPIIGSEVSTRLSPNSPVASNIARSTTQITPNIVTGIFGLKSVGKDSVIRKIQFRANSSSDLNVFTNWRLSYGSINFGATSYIGGVISFDNININLLKDRWTDLILKMDVAPGTNNISVSNTLLARSLVGIDVDYNAINTTNASDITGNVLNFTSQITSPVVGIACPQFTQSSPDWCRGGTVVPGVVDANGCTSLPTCRMPATVSTPVAVNCSVTPNTTKDYSVKTSVKGFTKCTATQTDCLAITTVTDACINTVTLKKYYCASGYRSVETHTCPNGCADGACASAPTVSGSNLNQLANALEALKRLVEDFR